MKKKGFFGSLSIVLCIALFSFLFYKTYHIDLTADNVYEIQVKTAYPYKEEIITSREEIEKFVENLLQIRITNPTYYRGKGWETLVTIKMRNEKGMRRDYRYQMLDEFFIRGSLRYKIQS